MCSPKLLSFKEEAHNYIPRLAKTGKNKLKILHAQNINVNLIKNTLTDYKPKSGMLLLAGSKWQCGSDATRRNVTGK